MLTAATHWWEVVGALGGAVGGIGAAVGAGAAWRAALASQATSRDALEALAVAIEPRMHLMLMQPQRDPDAPQSSTRLELNVRNSGRWPATDLDVEVRFADGESVRAHSELVDTMEADDDWDVSLRNVTAQWPPREPPHERMDVRLRYSDARGIARYEITESWTVEVAGPAPNFPVRPVAHEEPRTRRLR